MKDSDSDTGRAGFATRFGVRVSDPLPTRLSVDTRPYTNPPPLGDLVNPPKKLRSSFSKVGLLSQWGNLQHHLFFSCLHSRRTLKEPQTEHSTSLGSVRSGVSVHCPLQDLSLIRATSLSLPDWVVRSRGGTTSFTLDLLVNSAYFLPRFSIERGSLHTIAGSSSSQPH